MENVLVFVFLILQYKIYQMPLCETVRDGTITQNNKSNKNKIAKLMKNAKNLVMNHKIILNPFLKLFVCFKKNCFYGFHS